ncbi:MAG: transcription elongation factor GreA, partial [Chloroflexota bacterium]
MNSDIQRERQRAVPLTSAGRARLLEELNQLRNEREPRLTAQLREAREQGDAWEESSYYLALQEELARVQARIHELEAALAARPEEAAPQPDTKVRLGSRVTVQDERGQEQTFVIVSQLEADAARGHISASSPIGAGLLGHAAGDVVTIKVPAGQRTLTILK